MFQRMAALALISTARISQRCKRIWLRLLEKIWRRSSLPIELTAETAARRAVKRLQVVKLLAAAMQPVVAVQEAASKAVVGRVVDKVADKVVEDREAAKVAAVRVEVPAAVAQLEGKAAARVAEAAASILR
jgi:hypothetical protein